MKVAKCIIQFPGRGFHVIKPGDFFEMNELGDMVLSYGTIKPHPHFFEISEVPDGPWKPKAGEAYYALTTALDVFSDTMSGMGVDRLRIEAGNCFRTKEEAEAKLPAVRAALTGKSLKEVLEGIVKDNQVFVSPAAVREILAAWGSR